MEYSAASRGRQRLGWRPRRQAQACRFRLVDRQGVGDGDAVVAPGGLPRDDVAGDVGADQLRVPLERIAVTAAAGRLVGDEVALDDARPAARWVERLAVDR